MMAPNRSENFWMQLVRMGEILDELSSVKGTFQALSNASNSGRGFFMPESNFNETKDGLTNLKCNLEAVSCNVTISFLESALEIIEQAKSSPNHPPFDGENLVGWGCLDAGRIAHNLQQVIYAAPREFGSKTIIILEGSDTNYYDPQSPLFGEDVDKAFPSSSSEIKEAGKCLALGRWTAAVMHLMRALEPAIHALQAAVQVDKPKEQWGQIIDQIESKIKGIKKSTHGASDEQWYSDAATQFRYIKDAWRNYAQHNHERYDQERAFDIYNATGALMRQLATRLHE